MESKCLLCRQCGQHHLSWNCMWSKVCIFLGSFLKRKKLCAIFKMKIEYIQSSVRTGKREQEENFCWSANVLRPKHSNFVADTYTQAPLLFSSKEYVHKAMQTHRIVSKFSALSLKWSSWTQFNSVGKLMESILSIRSHFLWHMLSIKTYRRIPEQKTFCFDPE